MAEKDKPDFSLLLDLPFKWPEGGDYLFRVPSRPLEGAFIEEHPWARLVHMANGYREAGDILINKTEENTFLRNTLVYPIIFLYRHALELQLKYVLCTYGKHVGQEPNWESHRLDTLWNDARKVIEDISGSDDTGTNIAVEKCILEFSKADERSFTFRYPTTTAGSPVTSPFESIDLMHLKNTMEKLWNFFSGVDGHLDAITSA